MMQLTLHTQKALVENVTALEIYVSHANDEMAFLWLTQAKLPEGIQLSCWPTASRRRVSRSPAQEALPRATSRPRVVKCVTDLPIVGFAVELFPLRTAGH